MAGLYGMKRENYRTSLRAGWELISAVREGPFQIGMTECSTCKIQMEQGTSKPTIHPIKLLALGLRADAGDCDAREVVDQAAGGDMMVRVKLFAVAKQLAGSERSGGRSRATGRRWRTSSGRS